MVVLPLKTETFLMLRLKMLVNLTGEDEIPLEDPTQKGKRKTKSTATVGRNGSRRVGMPYQVVI